MSPPSRTITEQFGETPEPAGRGAVPPPLPTASRAESRVTNQDETQRASRRSVPPPIPAGQPPQDANRSRVGRYEVVRTLGQGAFGTVYLARDPRLDRDVAIKVPRRGVLQTQAEVERFLREARALAALNHPNICPIHDVGEVGDQPYIVMAYIKGQPLSDFPAQSLPPRKAAALVRTVALALQAAHDQGVIHRDLKASNVMIDSVRREPVVMDFGLARKLSQQDESRLTQDGAILGTPAYMPPEQARGDLAAMGPASDVYSLGVILYELLTGRTPFVGSVLDVLRQVLQENAAPPSTIRNGLDAELEAVCLKAIAKDPAQRFASMREFADALRDSAQPRPAARSVAPPRATVARPAPPLPAPAAPPRRRGFFGRLFRVVLICTILVVCAAIPALLIGGRFGQVAFATGEGIDPNRDRVFIDGAEHTLAALADPIWLRAGEHELTIQRDGLPVRQSSITVPSTTGRLWSAGRLPLIHDAHEETLSLRPDDFERTAAQRLLERGARITLMQGADALRPTSRDQLPAEPFVVSGIDLRPVPTFGDDDLGELRFLAALRELDASGTRLTDAAVDRLAAFAGLESLDVKGTQVTLDGVARLRAALPGCEIRHDAGSGGDFNRLDQRIAKGSPDPPPKAEDPPPPVPAPNKPLLAEEPETPEPPKIDDEPRPAPPAPPPTAPERTGPYALDLSDVTVGALPEGWTGSDAVGVRPLGGIPVLKSGREGQQTVQGPHLEIAGDFFLQLGFIDTIDGRLTLTLKGTDGKPDLRIEIYAAYRQWWISLPGAEAEYLAVPYFGPTDLRLERRKEHFYVTLNGDETQSIDAAGRDHGPFRGIELTFDGTALAMSGLRLGPIPMDEAPPEQSFYEWVIGKEPPGEFPQGWTVHGGEKGRLRIDSPPMHLTGRFAVELALLDESSGSVCATLQGLGDDWDFPVRLHHSGYRSWTVLVPGEDAVTLDFPDKGPAAVQIFRELTADDTGIYRVYVNGQLAVTHRSDKFGDFEGIRFDRYEQSMNLLGLRAQSLPLEAEPSTE